ncbi:hypothetical protein FXO37_06079 [Capsicum annuum]|nr:hypothetical protein FXO37_06079 [Capsicum annuum]
MPRLPPRSSRRDRRRRPIPPRSTTPPPPPQPTQPPANSWLEMGLRGRSVSFTFELVNQQILVHLQDPVYLATIITDGMRAATEAYINYMNATLYDPSHPLYSPMPDNMSPLPPGTELPFYHPEQVLEDDDDDEVRAPTVLYQNTFTLVVDQQVPSSNPDAPSSTQGEQSEEDTTPLPSMELQRGIRPLVYVLNSMKSFIIQEVYTKQYILKCPVRLNKCTLDARVITNPNPKGFGVLLVPTLVPGNDPDEDDNNEEPPKMTLMIWNCRGSEQFDFRKSYRSMLDYHRPGMVLLLETHMTEQKDLAYDFCFTNIADVPAIGRSGGMALVWKKDVVMVDGLSMNNEEIHCTIKVVNPPAE